MAVVGSLAAVFPKGTGVWAEDVSGEWSAMVVLSAADTAAVSVVRCADGAELKFNASSYEPRPSAVICSNDESLPWLSASHWLGTQAVGCGVLVLRLIQLACLEGEGLYGGADPQAGAPSPA
jgi:hypothetical protein